MVTGAAKLNGVLGIEATELVPVDALGTCIRLTPQEFLDTPNLLPRETSRTGRLNTALLGFRLGGYSYGSASWSSQELSQQQQGKKIAADVQWKQVRRREELRLRGDLFQVQQPETFAGLLRRLDVARMVLLVAAGWIEEGCARKSSEKETQRFRRIWWS